MPNSLYDDIPPWARLGFTATVLAELMQPGILQHLTFPQQLDKVRLFPQNYSHSSQILVTQRCTACKEKARGWSSASPCHDRGAIFLELWMASPHPSPWGADPIDGKPGVPEAHLWYLDGAHTKAWRLTSHRLEHENLQGATFSSTTGSASRIPWGQCLLSPRGRK